MIWWNYNWMYMFHEKNFMYITVCVCNNDCEWDVIENQNRITSFNLFCAHAISSWENNRVIAQIWEVEVATKKRAKEIFSSLTCYYNSMPLFYARLYRKMNAIRRENQNAIQRSYFIIQFVKREKMKKKLWWRILSCGFFFL